MEEKHLLFFSMKSKNLSVGVRYLPFLEQDMTLI